MKFERTGLILWVEKYDECVVFYRDVLGLRIMHQKREGDFALTCFEFGGSYLMIETGGVAKAGPKTVEENPVKLRFNVADIETARKHLREKGLNVEIEHFNWGSTINITDPDGNHVGIRDEEKFEG